MEKIPDRIYFMDSMRSVLMTLGVVLHSALIFRPQQSWVIFSNNTNEIADFIVQAIHLFRMPAFFVISGFFCVLTLKKYELIVFLKIRVLRILIPLLVTALTLNSLQIYILTQTGWHSFNIINYIAYGQYISHLWFLVNLAVYFCVAIVFLIFSNKIKPITNTIINYIAELPIFLIIIAMPFSSIAIIFTNKLGFPLYSNILNIFETYSILSYFPYFIFGSALGLKSKFLDKFSSTNPTINIILILSTTIVGKFAQTGDNIFWKTAAIYFDNFKVWISISLCFYCFKILFNKKSKYWLFMSDASYTIYLFHHIFVICTGLLIIKFEIPFYIGIPLTMSTSLAAAILIHKYGIMKFRILSLLFNGK